LPSETNRGTTTRRVWDYQRDHIKHRQHDRRARGQRQDERAGHTAAGRPEATQGTSKSNHWAPVRIIAGAIISPAPPATGQRIELQQVRLRQVLAKILPDNLRTHQQQHHPSMPTIDPTTGTQLAPAFAPRRPNATQRQQLPV